MIHAKRTLRQSTEWRFNVKITTSLLRQHDACANQVKLFNTYWPDGCIITSELCVAHALEFDWDWAARHLLSASANAKYDRATASAQAEYDRATAPAWAEYNCATASAWTEYERMTASDDRVAVPAWAEYKRVKASAWAEYERARAPAWAEYNRAKAATFGGLASLKWPPT